MQLMSLTSLPRSTVKFVGNLVSQSLWWLPSSRMPRAQSDLFVLAPPPFPLATSPDHTLRSVIHMHACVFMVPRTVCNSMYTDGWVLWGNISCSSPLKARSPPLALTFPPSHRWSQPISSLSSRCQQLAPTYPQRPLGSKVSRKEWETDDTPLLFIIAN